MKRLLIFDLDFTLWDAGGTWCDHTAPPYTKVNQHVVDSHGRKIVLYPEVRDLLNDLSSKNIAMALASRTSAPTWAKTLLNLFEIADFFPFKEIYPGNKIQHFKQLHRLSGVSFQEMVFFDDEMRNVTEVGSLGVNAIYIENGLTKDDVQKGLTQ